MSEADRSAKLNVERRRRDLGLHRRGAAAEQQQWCRGRSGKRHLLAAEDRGDVRPRHRRRRRPGHGPVDRGELFGRRTWIPHPFDGAVHDGDGTECGRRGNDRGGGNLFARLRRKVPRHCSIDPARQLAGSRCPVRGRIGIELDIEGRPDQPELRETRCAEHRREKIEIGDDAFGAHDRIAGGEGRWQDFDIVELDRRGWPEIQRGRTAERHRMARPGADVTLEAVAHHPARHRQRQACKHGQGRDEHEKSTRNRRTSQGPLCDDESQP